MNIKRIIWDLDTRGLPFRIYEEDDNTYNKMMDMYNFIYEELPREVSLFNTIYDYSTYLTTLNKEINSLNELVTLANDIYPNLVELVVKGYAEMKPLIKEWEILEEERQQAIVHPPEFDTEEEIQEFFANGGMHAVLKTPEDVPPQNPIYEELKTKIKK